MQPLRAGESSVDAVLARAVWSVAAISVLLVVLTEQFAILPAALAAYASAFFILRGD